MALGGLKVFIVFTGFLFLALSSIPSSGLLSNGVARTYQRINVPSYTGYVFIVQYPSSQHEQRFYWMLYPNLPLLL